jgi:hypothetical protein
MVPPMLPIHLVDGLIAAQTADRMLNHNAAAGEGPIVGHILRRRRLTAWFSPWRCA